MKLGEVHNGDAAQWGRPLDGVRVLSLEQYIALPFATLILARFGAEVTKVEPPATGEPARAGLPAITDRAGRKAGASLLRYNLGKQSLAIDLKTEKGRELLLALSPHFDESAKISVPAARKRQASAIRRSPSEIRARSICRSRASDVSVNCPMRTVRRWPVLQKRCRASTSSRGCPTSRRSRVAQARWAIPQPRCSARWVCSRQSAIGTGPAAVSSSTLRCSTACLRSATSCQFLVARSAQATRQADQVAGADRRVPGAGRLVHLLRAAPASVRAARASCWSPGMACGQAFGDAMGLG